MNEYRSQKYYAGRRFSEWGAPDTLRTITSPVMIAESPRTTEQADNTRFLVLPTPASSEATTNTLSGTRKSAESWNQCRSVDEIPPEVKPLYRGTVRIRDQGPPKHALHWIVHSHTRLKYTKRPKPNVLATRNHAGGESKCAGSTYERAELGVYC